MTVRRWVVGVRLAVAALVAAFVLRELSVAVGATLQYFTYTGSLVVAVTLVLVATRRVGERHLVLAFGVAAVIHAVYVLLLVGLDGVVGDLTAGGLENWVLHYALPYYLALDVGLLARDRAYAYRDAVAYLWVPAAYLAFVLPYGSAVGSYPYSFLDVDALGPWVAAYVVGILAAFVALNVTVIHLQRRRFAATALAPNDVS